MINMGGYLEYRGGVSGRNSLHSGYCWNHHSGLWCFIITLYNVCAVPWGVSTVGKYHEYCGGYFEYRGGIMINMGIS